MLLGLAKGGFRTFAGVRLVRNVPGERFYTLVYGLTVLLGIKLFWDAFA
jgi:uncharacterized membrane protein YfcA